MNIIECESAEDWYINLARCVLNYGTNYIKFCDDFNSLKLRFAHCEDIYSLDINSFKKCLSKGKIPSLPSFPGEDPRTGKHNFLLHYCKFYPQAAIEFLERLK